MALSSLKCNGTISFVYVKSGGRIMQISGRSDSLCIFLYEMDFTSMLSRRCPTHSHTLPVIRVVLIHTDLGVRF